MKKLQSIRPLLQLNKKNWVKYSCLWLSCQFAVALLTGLLVLKPAWNTYQKSNLQRQQHQQHAELCKQQVAIQRELQQQVNKLNQQHLNNPIDFDQQVIEKHWQGQLLQWLKQQHIHVSQLESNDPPDQQTIDLYQLIAQCNWSAFIFFFNRLQITMPFLELKQLQIATDAQQPQLVQFTADIEVKND
ncbi:MAG: hypothetical protein P1U63_10085 [Coxiellaceae bacterium]|nr:hypothetical protein [Coxiellaceae bacterium]